MTALRGALLATFTLGLATSISLAELSLAGLTLLLVARWRTLPRPAGWPLAVPLALFAAATLVAAAAAARPLESLVASKSLLTLAALWVVLHSLDSRAAAHRFAIGLAVVMALVAVVAIVQVGLCPTTPPEGGWLAWLLRKCTRARGFFSIYMTLAGVLVLVLVSRTPWLLRPGTTGWARDGVAWTLGLIALALTQVRGAWLGFVAGVVAVVAVSRRWLALVVLSALAVGTVLASPGVLDRVRSLANPEDETFQERLAMLESGFGIARDRPLTGVGPGQVKHVYGAYAPERAVRRHTSHLHNTPLQILVERGVPGLAAWALVFAAFFVRAGRVLARLPRQADADRALVLGSIAAVGAFLLAGLFEYNFGDTEVLLVACSLMALPFVVERDLGPAGDAGGHSAG